MNLPTSNCPICGLHRRKGNHDACRAKYAGTIKDKRRGSKPAPVERLLNHVRFLEKGIV